MDKYEELIKKKKRWRKNGVGKKKQRIYIRTCLRIMEKVFILLQ